MYLDIGQEENYTSFKMNSISWLSWHITILIFYTYTHLKLNNCLHYLHCNDNSSSQQKQLAIFVSRQTTTWKHEMNNKSTHGNTKLRKFKKKCSRWSELEWSELEYRCRIFSLTSTTGSGAV